MTDGRKAIRPSRITGVTQQEQPAYPVGSVDKALRLIVHVAEHPEGVRIADAAAALAVAPSTAHRLLQMLTLHGFAEQEPSTKHYFPGATLARLADRRERVRQVVRPALGHLVEQFGETMHVAALDGVHALTLLSVESPHLLRIGDRSGHRQLAAKSAMGRALLSRTDPDEIITDLKERGETVDARRLRAALKAVEADGHIIQHGEVEASVSAVAVPILSPAGRVGYALGATFPSGRLAEPVVEELVAVMKRSAVDIAADLYL